MKKVAYIVASFVVFLTACNSSGGDSQADTDSIMRADSVRRQDSLLNAVAESNDTLLYVTARQVLQLMSKKDYYRLAEFIHPQQGVRFVTYGYIDTIKQGVLFANDLIELSNDKQPRNWGIYEGSGDSINLTFDKFFDRFVYDVDFLNADTAINRVVGNTKINNVQALYPKSRFVQFYFSGVDPKYAGMDWKSLLLVFETKSGKYYLVSVVHDQWKA